MRLDRIVLCNFRCFESLEVSFDPRLTVIIAENGAGKTAILDAIAIGFGRLLTKLPNVSGRTTKETDLRIDALERRCALMVLAWIAKTRDGHSIEWASSRKRVGSVSVASMSSALTPELEILLKKGARQIDEFAASIIEDDRAGRPYVMPVVAYYGTNRAIRDEVHRRRGFRKEFSRFEALVGALDPDSRFRAAFEWFNAMEDQERREKEKRRSFDYELPELELVRNAIVRMLPPGFQKPRTEIRPLRFVIDRKLPGGVVRTLRISQLSDGYRVVLGLVMDLARRMAQANLQVIEGGMQIMNPLDLPAIVLIDEVDLHLHPAWQQHVLSDLMRVFPGAQFIVTTHSPQVLSTVRREQIRVIGPNAQGASIAEAPLAMTYGEPSGDVMQSVMMVDPQPPVIERPHLRRLTELVDSGQYESLEAASLLSELIQALGEQHPQLLKLRRSIRRQAALKG